MSVINMERLMVQEKSLQNDFQAKSPFRWLIIEDFLLPDAAQQIYEEYPAVDQTWLDANGLHTKNKFANSCVAGTAAAHFYQEVNSPTFRDYVSRLTDIPDLLPDENLFGAGYHQILDGGFLDVHVDFNKLDGSGLDRRLNLLVYLNPDWQESFGGQLELWDMDKRMQLAKILPLFNRAVIFETNEISYHGHPVPLNTNGKRTRKSLSVYYYTQGRDDDYDAPAHNTLYVNTEGASGSVKVLRNGVQRVESSALPNEVHLQANRRCK